MCTPDGNSERILGKAIGARRHDVVIATKVGNRMGPSLIEAGLWGCHILAAAEASLKRLGTDYIDVYLVHKVDTLTPVEETIEALEDLVRQGKVRYVGFSNWPAWLAAKAIGFQRARGWTQFRAAEMYYSLVGRDLEHEVVPLCRDAGVGVMGVEPAGRRFPQREIHEDEAEGDSGDRLGGSFIPYDRERVSTGRSAAVACGGARRFTGPDRARVAPHPSGGVVDSRRRLEDVAARRQPRGHDRDARRRANSRGSMPRPRPRSRIRSGSPREWPTPECTPRSVFRSRRRRYAEGQQRPAQIAGVLMRVRAIASLSDMSRPAARAASKLVLQGTCGRTRGNAPGSI